LKRHNWLLVETILEMPFDNEINTIADISRIANIDYTVLSLKLVPIEDSATKEFSLSKTIKDIRQRYNNITMEIETDERFGITLVKSLANYISAVDSDLLTVGVILSTPGIDIESIRLSELAVQLKIASSAMRHWESMQPLMVKVFLTQRLMSIVSLNQKNYEVNS
jgi:hypothetical protein